MERRELLKMIAVVTGGAMIGGEFLLSGCANPDKGKGLGFTEKDIAFLDEVADTILPKTSSAGAKEAGVGQFMTVYVNDCLTQENQDIFHQGMTTLNDACKKMHGHGFMDAGAEERTALLIDIDKERAAHQKNRQNGEPSHYFQLMKQYTLYGYFTSKLGKTTALNYVPVPGKFIGDYDYKKGDKIIAGLG